MKVLLIGYGSIGKRHFEILNSLAHITSIDIVTKQEVKNTKVFSKLSKVKYINSYDYFIIASQTSKHYEQLKTICAQVKNKKILVEKPLFDRCNKIFECHNVLFTAYNLRFHPVLEKLKALLKDEHVYYVNIICGQYLPTWRPEQDYRKSYSADINQGGGVLRDLSHELDYITWLFGDIKKIDSINTKISDLEINSDDIFTAIAVTENKSIINLTIDYISKISMRRMVVHTKEHTIEADFVNHSIIIYDKKYHIKTLNIEQKDRNYTYLKMHQSILSDNYEKVCNFTEGMKIVELIEKIEFKEL